jgi:hypothetical protein
MSRAATVVLPKRCASSIVVWYVASDVGRPRTISTSFMIGTGFMKCMPITRSGRPEAAASLVIEIDEVFDARMHSGRVTLPRLVISSSLSASFSGAASITKSRSARSAWLPPARSRATVASRCSAASLPFSTSLSSVLPSLPIAAAASSAVTSTSTTSRPAWAATWAMPWPIWPPPTTPRRAITAAPGAARCPRRRRCTTTRRRSWRPGPPSPTGASPRCGCPTRRSGGRAPPRRPRC